MVASQYPTQSSISTFMTVSLHIQNVCFLSYTACTRPVVIEYSCIIDDTYSLNTHALLLTCSHCTLMHYCQPYPIQIFNQRVRQPDPPMIYRHTMLRLLLDINTCTKLCSVLHSCCTGMLCIKALTEPAR